MRSFTSGLFKFLALLLTFVLGFATCVGVIVGGIFIAGTHLSLDSFGVDTSAVIDRDSAEVDLPSMTVQGAINEIRALMDLGDQVSLELLVSRYGLILPENTEDYIPENLMEMPLIKVFSEEGVSEILNNLYFGQVFGYTSEENTDTSDNAHKYVWFDPDTGEQIIGINHEISNYTLGQFISGGIDIDALVENVTIGEVMDMTSRDDFPVFVGESDSMTEVTLDDPITVWYDRGGEKAETIISTLAPYSVNDVEPALHSMMISDIMGFTLYGGAYYSWELLSGDNGEYIHLVPVHGIAGELAHISLDHISAGELDDEVKDMQISSVMGYTFNESTGKWENADGQLHGVMASVAGYKVGELDKKIGELAVGEIAGYTLGNDGKWYSVYDPYDPDNNVLASGVISNLAGLSVDDLTDEKKVAEKVEKITVAEALGFKKDGEKWLDKENKEVTGVLSVLAGEPINNIQNKINDSDMGQLLGYTLGTKTVTDALGNETQVAWWYSEDSAGNSVPTHALINKVAGTPLNELGGLTDELLLSDIISEEDRKAGFVSLADPNTPLTEMHSEMNDVFNNVTFDEFLDCGAITIADPDDEQHFREQFGTLTLPKLLDWVINTSKNVTGSGQ